MGFSMANVSRVANGRHIMQVFFFFFFGSGSYCLNIQQIAHKVEVCGSFLVSVHKNSI